LIAEYTWAGSGARNWTLSADYAFQGSSQLTFARSDNRDSDESHLLNFRLALDQPQSWQASLYVQNVLNETANTFAFGNPFSFRQTVHHTPPIPLTAGISFRKHF
jgi:outer membrane receptor protein involved in Fe transport